jgi:SAM-dependent MidA family methyltransferase
VQNDFESVTENPLLVEAVRQRIEGEGRITFEQFMAMALYHPQHGYYNSRRPKMGRHGDYVTSPEVHPIFGHLVAKQISQMWRTMDAPVTFDVLEMGAGNGLLCRDVLRWAQQHEPHFFDALRYRLSDASAELVAEQRRTLHELSLPAGKVEWLAPGEPPSAGSVTGCILSNELVDSFPVHRVAMAEGALKEVYVTYREGSFREELAPPSTPELASYFKRLGVWPGEGCRAEVNLAAVAWMEEVARALARGFVLTLDYGYPAEELYAPWRRDGTLLCFYRHNPSSDPYARLGRQDMTAHVDFTTLMETGQSHGLEPLGLVTQWRFLTALGIGAGLGPISGERNLPLEEHYARRKAVLELTDSAGLGRIRVLIQEKGVGACELEALRELPEAGPL